MDTQPTIKSEEITAWRIYETDRPRATLLKTAMSNTNVSLSQQEVFKKLLDYFHENELTKQQ